MDHPYKSAPRRAFWKKAVTEGLIPDELLAGLILVEQGEKIASAGSCFAANIVPFIERAGIEYIRTEQLPSHFSLYSDDNFSYAKFSAAYGNIYTVRHAVQLLLRALGRFIPSDGIWKLGNDLFVDPFRPGLRYPASSEREFALLTRQHLDRVLEVFRLADVFIFTLGLTEGWISQRDGAVYPACPGTISGNYDPQIHSFKNFNTIEVIEDMHKFIELARHINPRIRFIITVSPVPLVATATAEHVIVASTYSKSVLRVAASEVSENIKGVSYFPAYEIVSGTQAPSDYYETNRREPTPKAIEAVMDVFLGRIRKNTTGLNPSTEINHILKRNTEKTIKSRSVSNQIAEILCEEAAAET